MKKTCFMCAYCVGYGGTYCERHESAPRDSICESFTPDAMCMNCEHWVKGFDPLTRINGYCKLQDMLMWNNDGACNDFTLRKELK